MITAELRRAILAAAGLEAGDPLLRPGATPGSYASGLPFRAAAPGQDPRDLAAALAARLSGEPWIAAAAVTGHGYLTVIITHDALAGLAVRIARAGPACAESDALRTSTVRPPNPVNLASEPSWPQARAALAAHLTARLAATAGAFFSAERSQLPHPSPPPPPAPGESFSVARMWGLAPFQPLTELRQTGRRSACQRRAIGSRSFSTNFGTLAT